MVQKYYRFRIFLLMLALGLVSVPFFTSLSHEYTVASITLPQTNSKSPLILSPKSRNEMDFGGGSGPHGPDKPQETVNTLGNTVRPHIIENADLPQSRLQNADFTAAKITNSDFSYANLRKANFSKASIDYSSFIWANLKNTNFSGAKLFGSDLTGANFFGADLKRANFAHSDLDNAILDNSDLTDANFSDSRLKSVKGLTYGQLRKALINEFTSLPAKMESKRAVLLVHSRQRMKKLQKEMSAEELELFSNEFDFLY